MALSDLDVVTFDSYSTLVDVGAAERALEGVVDDPAAAAAEWRQRAVEYAVVANQIDAYQTYYECHRDGLEYALSARGVDDADLDEINAVYHDLDPFDDVREGVTRVAADYDAAVLSNGNPEMLDSLVSACGIGDALDATISADEVRRFKPAPEIYEHAADRMGAPIERTAHVSAGWVGVQGALAAGMVGIWLDREGTPWEPFDGEPDLVVDSLLDLADRL